MIQFNKLRLHGFKSFVDRTELEISEGLSGIVGPNGCGKSNLVEALRWVMGENSAKRMRGDGMEDVIFAGTDKRASRNIAEVTLFLDNSARTAPAAYNNDDELEVVRKIERDRGSLYKINGKTVRARDVQMLFADTVTGANSPALVSQGRIAQIINAKPHDRRKILEESAGISGLYARRHEAELRLKAADRNLVRIEDILGSMESRLGGLKRQARQATRYRNIGAQIRQFEILIAWLEYQALEERRKSTMEKFNTAESLVAEKLTAVTQLTKTQNTQMQDLPPFRQKEAALAAALQTQRLALQRLEDEAARLEQDLREAQDQKASVKADIQHETQSLQENSGNLKRLKAEQETLQEKQDQDSGKLAEKKQLRDKLESEVEALEDRYTTMMQGEAEAKARKQSLEQQIEQNTARIETLKARKQTAEEEFKALEGQNINAKIISENDNKISRLDGDIKSINEEIEGKKSALDTLRDQIKSARENLKDAETRHSAHQAEINMLKSFLSAQQDGSFKPVLDLVSAQSGFEKALSRALGDALMASLDDSAPSRWISPDKHKIDVKSLPTLPAGLPSLALHVKAPSELEAALTQIGFIEDEEQGDELAAQLKPGQSIVSAQGTYWRWDGFFMEAEASDRNAQHLEQKNKLATLERERPPLETALEKTKNHLESLTTTQDETERTLRQAEHALKILQSERDALKAEQGDLRESQVKLESENKRLLDLIKSFSEDIATLEDVIRWDGDRLKAHEGETSNRKEEDTEAVRVQLSEARNAYQEAIRAFDLFTQEQNSRRARLHAIADEHVNLKNRAIRSRERLKELEGRAGHLDKKLNDIKSQPKDSHKKKEELLTRISGIQTERDDAAENLAACEAEVTETTKALKHAETALSEAREARAHAQATLAGIQEQHSTLTESIRSSFDLEPHELPQHAALNTNKDHGSLDELKTRKERLLRERDNIGPVNLRAEDEAQMLEKELTGLLNERNDLMAAIDELRGGIRTINKEARERLVSAFEHVNVHFEHLFSRLFRGGKAYLELIDSDDPLDAGLEIYASPPGKALQSLSLLSGGEQALTSIALIFGMFLTNPSPICVLDEIDAPLDDANVERVCDLLDEIAARGETRFVIITHHRLTMARMDRLYGVTMSEQGVSQLVSVDLQQSFDFLEAA